MGLYTRIYNKKFESAHRYKIHIGQKLILKIQKILDSVIAIPPQKNFEYYPLHIHYFKTGSQFFISEYSLQKFI